MAEVISIGNNNTATTEAGYEQRFGSRTTNYASVDQGKAETQRKLMDWWSQVRAVSAQNREQQIIDVDFKDGFQWTEEDRQVLLERGQVPLVYNEIHPVIEWLKGTEKRTRVDWSVRPRTPDDVKLAHVKTELLKYVSDVNKLPFHRSNAAEDAFTAGVGWLELGVRPDAEDEMLFIRKESWRHIWLDPMSTEPDITDARYLFRSKLTDQDIAIVMFPEHEEKIKQEARTFERFPWQEDYDLRYTSQVYYDMGSHASNLVHGLASTHRQRKVIRLLECWYKQPARVQVIRSPSFNKNALFEPDNEQMAMELETGYATLYDGVRMQTRCAIMTSFGTILYDADSPYRHNRFPFVPIWAYRRGRDNMPYGPIRHMRDPQMDLNKRRSKSLHLLSTNKVIADEDAVEDHDLFEEEASRPDQVVWKKAGSQVEFINQLQLADAHMLYGQQDAEYIRQSSGVTAENRGMDTNAISGRAVLAKQEQGGVVTISLFDGVRLSTQLSGEIMLSLIEQFYTDQRVIRLTERLSPKVRGNVDGMTNPDFLPINQAMEDGGILNDITASQADFVVDEQDYRETVRQAMFDSLMQVISAQPPNIALQLLDLAFENTDLPKKDEIVKRIRQITGAPDPDDPNAEQAAQEQAAAAAQKQQQMEQLEMQRIQGELQKLMAEISKLQAQTQREATQSQKDLAAAQRDSAYADKENAETELVRRVANQNAEQDNAIATQAVNDVLGTPQQPDSGNSPLDATIKINT